MKPGTLIQIKQAGYFLRKNKNWLEEDIALSFNSLLNITSPVIGFIPVETWVMFLEDVPIPVHNNYINAAAATGITITTNTMTLGSYGSAHQYKVLYLNQVGYIDKSAFQEYKETVYIGTTAQPNFPITNITEYNGYFAGKTFTSGETFTYEPHTVKIDSVKLVGIDNTTATIKLNTRTILPAEYVSLEFNLTSSINF